MIQKLHAYLEKRRYIKFVKQGRKHLAAQFVQALEQDPLSGEAREYRVMRSINGKTFTNIAFIKR